jgi:hypothetical protein
MRIQKGYIASRKNSEHAYTVEIINFQIGGGVHFLSGKGLKYSSYSFPIANPKAKQKLRLCLGLIRWKTTSIVLENGRPPTFFLLLLLGMMPFQT